MAVQPSAQRLPARTGLINSSAETLLLEREEAMQPASQAINPHFRPDIQGLRAIAIFLVVAAHADLPGFSGGFIGVDVFFVLSGYLITGLLAREYVLTGRIDFFGFYARRFKRLLPALTVMVLASTSLAFWLLSNFEALAQTSSAPFAITWTSNLYFLLTFKDYFDDLSGRDLFLHTWSLGIEEQFYIFWPFVILLIFSRFAARTRVNTLLVIAAASFVCCIALSWHWPSAGFYLVVSRIWQFALGALVYLACDTLSPTIVRPNSLLRHLTPGILQAVGVTIIVTSAIVLHPALVYPSYWALMPSAGAALVLFAGYRLPNPSGGPLTYPPMIWIGDRSYSWYLWHWPILMLGIGLEIDALAFGTLSLVALSFLLAMLSYSYIELPFWKGSLSKGAAPRTLLVSVAVMTAVIAVFTYLPREETAPLSSPLARWGSDLPEIYSLRCDSWYEHARVEPCTFGSRRAKRTAVMLGDSIGAQWYSITPLLFDRSHWKTVVLTKSACPIVDVDIFYPRINAIYRVCTEWRSAVLDELDRIRPEVIIVGSHWTYDLSTTQWIEGSSRIFQRLSAASDLVLVIPGTPVLGIHGPSCLTEHAARIEAGDFDACTRTPDLSQVNNVTAALQVAATRFTNVHVLDLSELVCPDGECKAITSEGIGVFRDTQHLTDSFVKAKAPEIIFLLDEIIDFPK